MLEEETLVKQQAMDGIVDPSIAVQIHGLAKTYPGTTKLGCCKCTKTSPFHAVKVIVLVDKVSGFYIICHDYCTKPNMIIVPYRFLHENVIYSNLHENVIYSNSSIRFFWLK